MRMEQQLLFPGMVKEKRQHRKRSKRVESPKEEGEILYYGRYTDEDTLIFIEKDRAEHNAEIHTAMVKAEKAGLTWAEFEKKYPKVFKIVWDILERSGLMTFEEWGKETKQKKGRRRQPASQAQESPPSKEEYMKTDRWERMPLPEEPFNGEVVRERAPLLSRPYDGSEMWIPTEITDEFGEVQAGFSVDPYVTFKAEDAKKVTKAFRKHGYLCRRNDRLVEKSMGIT
jgi:hypothetical protein